MDAVIAEATSPPLPFPWQRAWPLAVCLFAAIVWLIAPRIDAPSIAAGPDLYTWFETIVPMATGWVAAGLVVSAIVTIVSLRMVRVK
jgi:type IV secretory pathway VirB2 component (pilin)